MVGVYCRECRVCTLCHRLYAEPEPLREDLKELAAILLKRAFPSFKG
jgi:hypothetical protein